MRILMFGASGRTGREIAPRLVAGGHAVTSLGRSDPGLPGLRHVAGDPGDAAAVAAALAESGAEAVVAALASSNAEPVCSRAMRAVLEGSAGRPLRYLTIGGAAVDAPGDAKGVADRIVSGIARLVAGRMIADRQAELDALRGSGLGWTMLRPPRLTMKPGTGRWTFSDDRPRGMEISRADLAAAAVEALGRADMLRRAPFVAGARG